MSSLVLPIAALLIGLVSLLIPTDGGGGERKGRLRVALIVLLIGLQGTVCVFSILDGDSKDVKTNEDRERIRGLNAQIGDLAQTLRNISGNTEAIRSSTATVVQLVSRLISQGFTPQAAAKVTDAEAKSALEADQIRTTLIDTAQPPEARRGKVVRVFAKDIDSKIVFSALETLGFTVDTRPPKLPDDRTNMIWYVPSKASVEDVRLVALTLMRAGILLRGIEVLDTSIAQNCHCSIQVGSSRRVAALPLIAPTQLAGATLPVTSLK